MFNARTIDTTDIFAHQPHFAKDLFWGETIIGCPSLQAKLVVLPKWEYCNLINPMSRNRLFVCWTLLWSF